MSTPETEIAASIARLRSEVARARDPGFTARRWSRTNTDDVACLLAGIAALEEALALADARVQGALA